MAPCLVTVSIAEQRLPLGSSEGLLRFFVCLFIIYMSAHFGPNTEERGSLLHSNVLAFQLGGQEGLPRNITVTLNPRGSRLAINVISSRCT